MEQVKVENFDNWSEDAKWAVAHLLCFIPDKFWTTPTPSIHVEINGYVVEDLQTFFEELMLVFRSEVKKQAASEILRRFDGVADLWYDLFQSARESLKDELRTTFGVTWDRDDEIYHDWTSFRKKEHNGR